MFVPPSSEMFKKQKEKEQKEKEKQSKNPTTPQGQTKTKFPVTPPATVPPNTSGGSGSTKVDASGTSQGSPSKAPTQPATTKPGSSTQQAAQQSTPQQAEPAPPQGQKRSPTQTHDVYEDMRGYIRATPWAKPYFSNHHHENSEVNTKMLGHVNCGYLSTPGRPPTLECLKQHAQSLTFLISTLAPSHQRGLVDAHNTVNKLPNNKTIDPQIFEEHQAYDWLNNLQVPYDNIDKSHRRPLNSLANLVKKNSDEKGVEYHCPMDQTSVSFIENDETQIFPFQNHMTLLMHANECLERLDHEYSAMGGLLSIIPTDQASVNEHPDLPKAKQTLIGQWLLYTQHLTGRMHELEIAYANALDIIAGEAQVPAQHLSMHGPDGRTGREIVFPQDRWLLANAGEDVYEFVHRMLDRKEQWLDAQDAIFLSQHAVGDRLKDGDEVRGIVHVDLQSRFYRMKGSGRGTIFVLPAYADRPNTEHTRELENRPTVVTLPTPSYPNRTTAWDRRNLGIEQVNLQQSIDLTNKEVEIGKLRSLNETYTNDLERLRLLNKIYEEHQGNEVTQLATRTANAEAARGRTQSAFEKLVLEGNAMRNEILTYKQERKQKQAAPVLPDVTRDNYGTYSLNEQTYQRYAGRVEALEEAKTGIARVQSALLALIQQGHLKKEDFAWMDTVVNTA
ncbi:hypothetical protein GGR53DRAFT_509438 [Hypoxylon sp. FL1150]|nr:hypothetical protein GGR53DRAFT_509438 [Hypoxylon sp. FL1150]